MTFYFSDVPSYNRPNFPSPTGGAPVASPRLAGTPKLGHRSPPYTTPNSYPAAPPGYESTPHSNVRQNPLKNGFDITVSTETVFI